MEKNPNINKIQRNGSVKCTGIFDQRHVRYVNFEQQLTETDSLGCLLHSANNEHDNTKGKNKQRKEAPTAV